MKVPQFLLIGVFVCALSACQESEVSRPQGIDPSPGLQGEWSGFIGEGTLILSFHTSDKTIQGTVTLDLGEGPETYAFERLEWFSPQEFRIKLPCLHVCERVLTGITLDANTLQGSYTEEYTLSEFPNVYQPWTAAKNPAEPTGSHHLN